MSELEQEQVAEQAPEKEDRQLSPIEEEALAEGWKPKEEFDGDPDKWVSAREYVRYGKLQKTMNTMKADFDSRLREVNQYHEMQKQAAISELKAQQKLAVRGGDEEAFDAIQQRIDQFEQSQSKVSKDPVVAAWEERNPWIMNQEDPRTVDANALYVSIKARKPNISESEALAYVDERLAKLHTPTNPRRDVPPRTETGGQRSTGKSNGKLHWGDLSESDLRDWKNFGETMFKTKDAFLKAVSDARKK